MPDDLAVVQPEPERAGLVPYPYVGRSASRSGMDVGRLDPRCAWPPMKTSMPETARQPDVLLEVARHLGRASASLCMGPVLPGAPARRSGRRAV